jgi:hypothetical protein
MEQSHKHYQKPTIEHEMLTFSSKTATGKINGLAFRLNRDQKNSDWEDWKI